jgi:ectoine hydroxylase-related dioxygenase (phytanoyl-CoA dioxygenase family)
VVLYLSDVSPGGGGFTVWPGSHHVMAKHHGSLGDKDRLPTFDHAVDSVGASTQPVEVSGPTGTVVFWHQRIVHTAGINTSKTVRHATLCDFKNERFLAAAECAAADPWETWSPRVRQQASVREEREGARAR